VKEIGLQPTPSIMTVPETLNWIAFPEVRPEPDDAEGIDVALRWSDSDLAVVLEALKARASAQPFYLVQPVILDGQPWDRKSYGHRLRSPSGPEGLRRIRAAARRREGRLLTFPELAQMLRHELTQLERQVRLLDEALTAVTEAVRVGKLDAWALQDTPKGELDPSAVYARVPPSVLFNDMVALTELGSIGADPDHPIAIFKYRGPRYREVRFRSEDVLALWPAMPAEGQAVAPLVTSKSDTPPSAVTPSPRGAGGAPVRYDWDAFWIELAIWTENNGLEEFDRSRLHRHMVVWAARQWSDPPDESTIRGKLKRFYENAKTAQVS
jgi:hypothetical protein